jgi:uncharacterized membrane protein
MTSDTAKSGRLEGLLAGVLNSGTWLASAVITLGLAIPLFDHSAHAYMFGTQVVAAGIGLLIMLPIMRVILMLVAFLRQRDYRFVAAAAFVLTIIMVGVALGASTAFMPR